MSKTEFLNRWVLAWNGKILFLSWQPDCSSTMVEQVPVQLNMSYAGSNIKVNAIKEKGIVPLLWGCHLREKETVVQAFSLAQILLKELFTENVIDWQKGFSDCNAKNLVGSLSERKVSFCQCHLWICMDVLFGWCFDILHLVIEL